MSSQDSAVMPLTGSKRSCSANKSVRSKRARTTGSSPAECKTCSNCRLKKIKCDSRRPTCQACQTNNAECVYPRDTRCLSRPSEGRIGDLEEKVSAIWDFITATATTDGRHERQVQVQPSVTTPLTHAGDGEPSIVPRGQLVPPVQNRAENSTTMILAVPPALEGDLNQNLSRRTGSIADHDGEISCERSDSYTYACGQIAAMSSHNHASLDTGVRQLQEQAGPSENLTSHEARIAGVDVDDDGGLTVHGPSSMMHRRDGSRHEDVDYQNEKARLSASKARLISYAVVQRQTEAFLYMNPPDTLDLDGVDIELARHLLDLHWNRQHLAYLLTYRPAVMDSLFNGGPWCNKLLLNAMYYTSCLYSDRESLRKSPEDTQSAGDRFYDRFRMLLVDEIVRPSIPSAAALLLTGASLVSQGRISAGWNFCGLAYRMVIDMGCHLATSPRATTNKSASQDLTCDIEDEWRRRLYWGALITDATQSLYLGRQMTLRPNEGKVPQLFLDTYEELEEWSPYIDGSQNIDQSLLLSYTPRPTYAVSTFGALVKLAQISAEITQAFYSLDCAKGTQHYLLSTQSDIELKLHTWERDLPVHLRYDVTSSYVPPPHQITPHTTFHVLNVLLRRPFLDDGHLQQHMPAESKTTMENSCMSSALAIRQLVSAYRDTFTLRRTPFLLSYAVYSAVVVILRQSQREGSDNHIDSINFFLTALAELQRGCNFGLRKPMNIIRSMIAGLSEVNLDNSQNVLNQVTDIEDFQFPSMSMENDYNGAFASDYYNPMLETSPVDFFGVLNDQERMLTDDTLYGLFSYQASAFQR